MADGRHFENRKIAISQWKIVRFCWNLVYCIRCWTRWQPCDQKLKSDRKTANINTEQQNSKNHLVYSSTQLGHGCNYMTSITSTAQWSTRINKVIFAVLDVSWTMGLNSGKTSKVFCINICCFVPNYIFFVPQWHSQPCFMKIVDVFDLCAP